MKHVAQPESVGIEKRQDRVNRRDSEPVDESYPFSLTEK